VQMFSRNMKNKLFTTLSILVAVAIPAVSYAQTGQQVAGRFVDVLEGFIWLVVAFAVLYFLWNIFLLAFSKKEDERERAKVHMVWGVIALTVMVFVWGFVFLLTQFVFDGEKPDVSLLSAETDSLQETPKSDGTAGFGRQGTVQGATGKLVEALGAVIPFMLSLGVLIFIWGVFQYIREDNIKKKAAASAFMGWGIVLLFVMSFVWVIVIKIGETTQIDVQSGTNVSTQKVDRNGLIRK